jgi:hypothetical protein
MTKRNFINDQISELINDPDISDESISIIYQFLTDLLLNFESQAFGRLRRYYNQRQKKIDPNLL